MYIIDCLNSQKGGVSWLKYKNLLIYPGFESSSKRKKGFPSETKVKKGQRIIRGYKELTEKLGRNDLCPCNSGIIFKKCCLKKGKF